MSEKIANAKTILYIPTEGPDVTTGTLIAESWYVISQIAPAGSGLPAGFTELGVFHTGSAPPTLVAGDVVRELTFGDPLCKTTTDMTLEESSFENGDDCEAREGTTSNGLTGIVTPSGTYNGFLRYDPATQSLADQSKKLVGFFIKTIEDDGAGNYTVTNPPEDKKLLAMSKLNTAATASGSVETWIIMYQYLTTMALGGGIAEAQKRDINWIKGPGPMSAYYKAVA